MRTASHRCICHVGKLPCTKFFYLTSSHRVLHKHAHGVYLQPAETRVRRGATLPLLAAHNSLEMMFTIEEDKLTRKGADCELLPHPADIRRPLVCCPLPCLGLCGRYFHIPLEVSLRCANAICELVSQLWEVNRLEASSRLRTGF